MIFRDRLKAAFDNTPVKHISLTTLMRMRGSLQSGSWYEGDVGVDTLLNADWKPFQHEALWPGAEAFKAPLEGFVGVVRLTDLAPLTKVRFVDPKSTLGTKGGGVSCEVMDGPDFQPIKSPFTTIILMVEDGKEQVATWFPGEPTPLPTAKDDPSLLGVVSTAEDAIRFGFVWAKMVQQA
jgi:hypothetical protein